MVVVPPPFEAVDKTCFLFRYGTIRSISYPFNGGVPCIPTQVQDASHKSIPQILSYRAPTYPDSLGRNKLVYSSCSTS
jgi:hypothetical protein